MKHASGSTCYLSDFKTSVKPAFYVPCAIHPLLYEDSSNTSRCGSVLSSPLDFGFVVPPRGTNPILSDPNFNPPMFLNSSKEQVCCSSAPHSPFLIFDDEVDVY
ncbi:hypothetical protein EIN_348100 [Entamoeba invadens IP1]|uniref:Uncharacterized protein n=1 Tax=Entamoeba invadens IP1 TaxID=370355 RepID=L7FK28_ENTIV|nr:hypothetical protein EIN_348100 [Entamoeba invadens IP1]ELP84158.1 hypothetical protein EIN_348100 [Entamoeba invadens IP1]|eukprot:XP_004183504.1 hypothetical protein EIN_348100 [Entamoeba invadens IP1]